MTKIFVDDLSVNNFDYVTTALTCTILKLNVAILSVLVIIKRLKILEHGLTIFDLY